jgi:hypothetical protein
MEALIPIRSEDELRFPLVLFLKSCAGCGGDHPDVLVLNEGAPRPCKQHREAPHRGWLVSGTCFGPTKVVCFAHDAIPAGRLFLALPAAGRGFLG